MLRITNTTQSGATYTSPFIQTHRSPDQIPVDVTAFTSAEVTADGSVKPGVPIRKVAGSNGTLITAAAQIVAGVTVELTKVAASNSAADLTAAGVVQLVIGREGMVSRQLIEEMLGRVLNANEIAGFGLAGSQIILRDN
jgi:hypothetical protein